MIQTDLDTLEYNINNWLKIVAIQERNIANDVDSFPYVWKDYINAKTQLKRVKDRFGTLETYEIKDLYR